MVTPSGVRRRELTADCDRCAALCCVVPAFARSADFAVNKPAGTPCRNLTPELRCGIHAELRGRGFAGCAVFDCFGAGQHVTQVTYGGHDWRASPDAAAMPEVFRVVRQLHELLRHVGEALARPEAAAVHPELRRVQREVERRADGAPAELAALDVDPLRAEGGELLARASELVRERLPRRADDRRGADLVGADLRGEDLRGASLRGALLLGADLRGAALDRADLLGADLRAADVRGTDLSTCLFLTQPQVGAARGDARTGIPAVLARPPHWTPPHWT
ncbi:pentapeptide repeat-containing protein [Geodermatophilus sp. YIM 151500]|uniref:pentapeptide repeat-containing protein n=1 Tax=Geodermatophilus sp. YIM 151500 TaxID=2984531 RepID=UPI0021E49877|nr:pentapeptide repeat-containing protein [Geodermatophilus sp. YIM 151500]MCV2489151.1 pentapeptide repeat-containing protein [Geodermatophilus sp. YIM 151500]